MHKHIEHRRVSIRRPNVENSMYYYCMAAIEIAQNNRLDGGESMKYWGTYSHEWFVLQKSPSIFDT